MFSNTKNLVFTGGTFNYHHQTQVVSPDTIFKQVYRASAPRAVHTSGERFDKPKCHPNTRVAILQRLKDWLNGIIDPNCPLLWLYGAAGAGKSAIAQTMAEISAIEEGLVLGSFFFAKSDPTRNTIQALVPTLSYQFGVAHPISRAAIERAVNDNPMVFEQSLEIQLEELLCVPLLQLAASGGTFPRLIVVDGLDECSNVMSQCRLITALLAFSQRLNSVGIPIRILIASRPEQHLLVAFNADIPAEQLSRIALNDSLEADDDICRFLTDKLEEVKRFHPMRYTIPPDWPGQDIILQIVQKASGQFIFASIVAHFVSSIRHSPMTRLNVILGVSPPPKSRDMPFAELDAIYTYLLSSLDDTEMALLILGVHLILTDTIFNAPIKFPKPWENGTPAGSTVRGVARCLSVDPAEVLLCVSNLSSIIDCLPEGDIIVRHASLSDYLQDPRRSGEFYIDRGRFHAKVCLIFLRNMEMNRDLEATRYAYKWLGEFVRHAEMTPELKEALGRFSVKRADAWTFSGQCRSPWPFWTFLIEFYTATLAKLDSGPKHRAAIDKLLRRYLSHISNNHRMLSVFKAIVIDDDEIMSLSTSCATLKDTINAVIRGIEGPEEEIYTTEDPRIQIPLDSLLYCLPRQYIREFLCNKSRCGPKFFDAEAFSEVTTRCLESLSNDQYHGLFAVILVALPTLLKESSPCEPLLRCIDSEGLWSVLSQLRITRSKTSHTDQSVAQSSRHAVKALLAYVERCEPPLDTLRRVTQWSQALETYCISFD